MGEYNLPDSKYVIGSTVPGTRFSCFHRYLSERTEKGVEGTGPVEGHLRLLVGYPSEAPEPGFRRDWGDFTHFNHFEITKMRPDGFVEEARKDPSKLFFKKA